MSTSRLSRGRVLRADEIAGARPAVSPACAPAHTLPDRRRGRVLPAAVMHAHDEARAVIDRARADAARIVADAHAEVEARVAAALAVVHAEDERRAERDLERVVATAVVLAERLVGAALEVDPSRIGAMAQAALREARGARRITFEANPLDAEALRAQLESLGLTPDQLTIEPRDDLARGDLVLRTELGSLDARLKPQLERLQGALSRAQRR